MKIPTLSGLIRRRILVNYRVEPDVLQRMLPSPFQPKLVHGYGIAGICLIRLEQIHPRLVPISGGFSSENAAHRIAVTWDANEEQHEGVYIPRRDTSSYLNVTAGGRIFPGMHHHSRFEIAEDEQTISIEMHNDKDNMHLEFEADYSAEFQGDSIFNSINEASAFFEGGSVGYSVTALPSKLDAIELRTFDWRLHPLAVKRVVSSFYENRAMFPDGSISFDCALVIKNLAHEWHAQKSFAIQPAQN